MHLAVGNTFVEDKESVIAGARKGDSAPALNYRRKSDHNLEIIPLFSSNESRAVAHLLLRCESREENV